MIVGIGGVTLRFTDTFELGGIALGTLIVVLGYHGLRLAAPAHMKHPQAASLDAGCRRVRGRGWPLRHRPRSGRGPPRWVPTGRGLTAGAPRRSNGVRRPSAGQEA